MYSQEQLSSQNTSWTSVLSGNVNSVECLTSYGFCLQTDARTICAFSSTGKLLWEKKTGRSKNTDIFPLEKDFILLSDNQASKIKMINPSGNIIWEKSVNSPVIQKPLNGRDGRFFIFLSDSVLCYTKNGNLRWTYNSTVQQNLLSQELPDGTILIFCGQKDNKTYGIRLSPFGEALEEITFSGIITDAESCSNGIVLYFSDGSLGLLGLDDDSKAVNKWVFTTKSTGRKICVSNNKKELILFEPSGGITKACKIDLESGNIISSFEIPLSNIFQANYSESGIVVFNDKKAFLFSKDGNIKWEAKMPENFNSNYTNAFLIPEGYLIFCEKNWSIKAYKIFYTDEIPAEKTDYSAFYTDSSSEYEMVYTAGFDSAVAGEKIIKELKDSDKNGLKNGREIEITSNVYSAVHAYYKSLTTTDFGTRKEKSIFETDTKGFASILRQLTMLNTDDSAEYIASLLEKSTNSTYLSILLEGIKEAGYDPERKILNSLEILASRTDYKATALINQICDAVYSICSFMGKPAYNSKGKDILKKFLYPSYSSQTRTYARKIFQQISDLDL
ncbi:MAG: PQQ-binding-like beta-propeller repeat protein [Treponema sp.]|nr:PQQ-binding-like beta-propeller repeat protein [Treponema sp.]